MWRSESSAFPEFHTELGCVGVSGPEGPQPRTALHMSSGAWWAVASCGSPVHEAPDRDLVSLGARPSGGDLSLQPPAGSPECPEGDGAALLERPDATLAALL